MLPVIGNYNRVAKKLFSHVHARHGTIYIKKIPCAHKLRVRRIIKLNIEACVMYLYHVIYACKPCKSYNELCAAGLPKRTEEMCIINVLYFLIQIKTNLRFKIKIVIKAYMFLTYCFCILRNGTYSLSIVIGRKFLVFICYNIFYINTFIYRTVRFFRCGTH